jgi:predicted GH43/DUF377 family glycosyl hydrolase
MIEVKKHGILLDPTELQFENQGVTNPSCIELNGKIQMFYRAIGKENYSSIGYCELKAPTEVSKRSDKPALIPQGKYESMGMEDPRIVRIDDTYYITYTAYDGTNALGALATSRDMETFDRKGVITAQMTYKEFESCIKHCERKNDKYLRFGKFFSRHGGIESPYDHLIWDKDVVFFPKRINGKFAFIHRIYPDIQIAYFNDTEDLTYQYWMNYLHNINKYIVLKGKFPFEASYIGGGCPPVETSEGWLIIYHGVEDTSEGYIYHACAALLDLNEPTKEIGRLKYPLFSPELDWEKQGVVNNVVFPSATVLRGDSLFIYYGAADKYIGVASVSLKGLTEEIKNSK